MPLALVTLAQRERDGERGFIVANYYTNIILPLALVTLALWGRGPGRGAVFFIL